MSKLYSVLYKPKSVFKEVPNSWTIFGAICWYYRIFHSKEELENLLENFENNPKFLVSSPTFIKNDIEFFKKPNLGGSVVFKDDNEYREYKKFKKIQFIDRQTLIKILEGEIKDNNDLFEKTKNKIVDEIISNTVFPHVSINRITFTTDESKFFIEKSYSINSFLKFYILFFDENLIEKLKPVLKILYFSGKGISRGIVEFIEFKEEIELSKYIKEKSNKIYLLSPSFYDEKFDLGNSYYDIITTLGIVDNYFDFKKLIIKGRFIYLSDGSIIQLKSISDYYGSFSFIKYNFNKIYQYGYSFGFYIKGG
jgi:CRISPR-associated protein Csm4